MTHISKTGPDAATCHLILAHGARAGHSSAFLECTADLLGARGICVVRFDFDYMAARREGRKTGPPPRAERLTTEYAAAIDFVSRGLEKGKKILIGGKSMGGRVASLIASQQFQAGRISGLVCLGYPFHPPGAPERLRTAHLETMDCPTLIVQGTRDPFGSKAEVERLALSPRCQLHWIDDGDHDFAPRRASGLSREGNMEAAADAVAAFAGARRGRR